jgi:hypothetical protein
MDDSECLMFSEQSNSVPSLPHKQISEQQQIPKVAMFEQNDRTVAYSSMLNGRHPEIERV